MRAVLIDGIETAFRKRLNENGYTSKYRSAERRANMVKDAREWIASEDDSHVFTFVQCCYYLGLDPEWLRGKVWEVIEQMEEKNAA